ncbi:MAG: phosphonoacetaldehyde reductase [Acidimicrobiia bacterium]
MKPESRAGEIERLAGVVGRYDPRTVMVFSGGKSYETSGAAAAIEPLIADLRITRVSEIAANPDLAAVESAIEEYREDPPDLVLAVGGGSVIDLAKSTRALAPQPFPPRSLIAGTSPMIASGAPLVAIPTTAGTGAESTHFAVVYVDGVKRSLSHESIRPDAHIIDPVLTYSVPPAVTAHTGLDALSQAIESWWSIRSNDASLRLARNAVAYAISALEDAVLRPGPDSRALMCEASHLAGCAIDITRTTAAHAMSYTLTGTYGVPHGHAVALMLGPVFDYNAAVSDSDCADKRGPEYVTETLGEIAGSLGAPSASDTHELIVNLISSIGLDTTLDGVGAGSSEARHRIAASVDADRLSGNPRTFSPAEVESLISAIP